jgi:thiol-disulfide isomerase/thioredoxin
MTKRARVAVIGLLFSVVITAVAQYETEEAVDFTLQQLGGGPVSLSDYRGEWVVVNYWATWCAPCRKEMPDLAELERQLGGDDFEVVAVSVDRKGAEASAKFLAEHDAGALKLYIDRSAAILDQVKAIGLPTSLLIDRSGRVIGRLTGPAEWSSPDAVRLVEAALEEGRMAPGYQCGEMPRPEPAHVETGTAAPSPASPDGPAAPPAPRCGWRSVWPRFLNSSPATASTGSPWYWDRPQ